MTPGVWPARMFRSMPKRTEILDLRRQLARAIVRSLGPGGRYVVAPSYGIGEARFSELAREQVSRCSVEWLIERVYRMGGTVTLDITLGNAGRAWYSVPHLRAPRAPRAPRFQNWNEHKK